MTQHDHTPLPEIINPQPLGIFPLPVSYLLLPPTTDGAAALAELLRGVAPSAFPAPWRFYGAALAGDTDAALALLAADDSPEAHYNCFVLSGDAATYHALRDELDDDLARLLDMVAYTMGLADAPPDPGESTGVVRAVLLAAQAAAALEQGDFLAAQATLTAAVEAARPASPLFAAQLLADLAEARIAGQALDALALQHYREALHLLDGSGLTELRAHMALRLATLYQELARGQRGPLLEAVKCYQEALRVFTRTSHPEPYALAQNNLALAYLAMPLNEAGDQLRMAVAVQALREAVAVYAGEGNSERWASAQLNLANALQYLPSAHPEDHLTEAVQIYEALLHVRDAASDPPGYARLLANQGNALAHLGIFDHARAKLRDAERRFADLGEQGSAAAVAEVLAEIDQRAAAAPAPATESVTD